MRPMSIGPFTPAVALTTAFNAQGFTSTGAATAPTTTATSDGLAHLVTLTSPSQASLAGVTFTVVGTDADGHAVTDSFIGPASASTVTSSKYFKNVTTIQPSATMGVLTVAVGIAVTAITQTLALTNSVAAAGITVAVTGTINYTMYETFINVFTSDANSAATSISALAAKSTLLSANSSQSATGVFLMINSLSATATITVYLNQNSSGFA